MSDTITLASALNLAFESQHWLYDIGPLKPPPCAVADVQHSHLFLLFQYAVYRAINVWLVTVQQVPELVTFGCHRTTIRLFLQAENRLLESAIPFQCRIGMFSVDLTEQ